MLSDQNNLFDEEQKNDQTKTEGEVEENKANPNPADIFVEKLLEIQREDGTPKYESVTDALEALKHSQEHIRKLEAERATEKERLEYLEKIEKDNSDLKQLVERLGGNKMNEENPKENTTPSGGLSAEQAEELIKKHLETERSTREKSESLQRNLSLVTSELANKYGPEKARELVASKAKELDLSLEELKAIAAEKPKAVLAMFGQTVKASTPNTSSTHVPPRTQPDKLEAPEKSLLSGVGATDANRMEFIRRIKEKVYRENGISL